MTLIAIAAVAVSALLALNIGGNNSAAEMGPAFGAGVRSKREAVFLIAVFSVLGAVFCGDRVVNTISHGLVPETLLAGKLGAVVIILLSAAIVIAIANVMRVPIATSHAVVGAVVGIGIFFGTVNWDRVMVIIVWWLVTPLAALTVSYSLGRWVHPALGHWLQQSIAPDRLQRCYRILITISGCYMAFAGGANSLAKAVGPLVGAGVLPLKEAALLGGAAMAVGALLVGQRLLQTVGKGITSIDPLTATLIEFVSGTILMAASRAGVPVSLAEIVTCAVVGFSCVHRGARATARNKHVRTIYTLWPACPVATAAISVGAAVLVRGLVGI